jgi:tRNA(Ile)-lysidine synthase
MGKSLGQFVARMQAYIDAHGLLAEGESVLAGFSGGADSLAMTAALHETGLYRLAAVHVHHGIRGADADADEAFADGQAAAWGIPLLAERIDVPSLARRWGVGVEEAARRGRYEVFVAAAGSVGASAVALAHHADDQAETILHRIVRGTHLRGLAGMPAQRPLSLGVRIVRPLLWARRAEVEDYCRRRGLPWRTDHTNAQTDYTRNFIRNELLPLLRDRINPRADEALLRLSSAARDAEEVLDELAAALFDRACRKRTDIEATLRIAPLRKAPPALAAFVLRKAMEAIGAPQQELSQERFGDLLSLLAGEASAVDLPGDVRAARRGQLILLTRRGRAGGNVAAGEDEG